MSVIHDFDWKLRKIFSICFRVIVIVFALFVVCTSENILSIPYYIASSAVYFTCFILIFYKDKYSKVRLLFDYLFIFFVLYGKTSNNLAALLISLLPLINSPNHSGRSSSPFFVVFLTVMLFIYLIRGSSSGISNNTFYTLLYILIPFVLYFIIVAFEVIRTKLIRLNEYFNNAIDEYYENNLQFSEKPYKILRSINTLINNTRLIPFKIDRLICFKILNDKMEIVGGTKFVFKYTISEKDVYILHSRDNEYVKNWDIVIDGQSLVNNFSFIIKTSQIEYLFLFTSKSSFNRIFYIMIKPIFNRLVKILSFEDSLALQKTKYLERLKNKIEFVEDAQVAMHFIKNKLSPVANTLAISKDLENIEAEREREAISHFRRELAKVESNISLILEKAQKFLSNVDKPFSLSDFKSAKAKKLIALLRSNWNSYFSDDEIEMDVDIEQINEYTVEINEDLIEFLLTNWISNMHKYSVNVKKLTITEKSNELIVLFENDFKGHLRSDVQSFVKDFNSYERNEIINRGGQTRGLRELKLFVRELGITNLMELDLHLIRFSLTFKMTK